MVQLDIFMPTFKKIIRAAELPVDWAREFTNPDQLVVVTIRDTESATVLAGQHRLDGGINLAAPSEADKVALRSMPLSAQKHIYETAIQRESNQSGRKLSKADIRTSALKLPHNG